MKTTTTPPATAQDTAQTLAEYPPKPEATHWQRHYGYEPATVIRWEWSDTFGRWGAVVQFADGAKLYTWPQQPRTELDTTLAVCPRTLAELLAEAAQLANWLADGRAIAETTASQAALYARYRAHLESLLAQIQTLSKGGN